MRSVWQTGTGVAALVLAAAAPASAASDVRGVAPRLSEAPEVDGSLGAEEWKGAFRVTGVRTQKRNPKYQFLEERMATAFMGFTEERLHLAVVSELPPDQRLTSEKRGRDSNKMVFDSSVEMWLAPYRKGSQGEKLGEDYFQFIVNSNGDILDTAFRGGNPDPGWNADWKTGNGVHKDVSEGPEWMQKHGVWVCEISVPFTDLGIERPDGRTLGLLLARNWHRNWDQATWLTYEGGGFSTRSAYPKIRLADDAPAVQITDLGTGVFKGELALNARIFNPGPTRKVSVDLRLTSSDMPSLEDKQTLEIREGETARYRYEIPPKRFHEQAKHRASLTVREKGRKAPLLDWNLRWTKAAKKPWAGVKTGPQPKKAVKLAYFPSYKFVRLRVDRRFLGKNGAKARKAAIRVTGPDGKKHLAATMPVKGEGSQEQFEIGALEDGRYTAKITLMGSGYERSFERSFRRKHFVWEGNDLGKTSKVYPPFEPVGVAGDTVSVVLRDYELGPLGFFKSLRVSNNAGSEKELLAAPSKLKANGEALEGTGRITDSSKRRAVHEGRAASPAVTVETRTITAYDGAHRVEMTLKPGTGKKKLKQLTLEIPIKDKHAPLFHVSSTTIRRNPAGATPKGSGLVWDSRDYPDGEWVGNFKPYLWVGGPERGLSFFADNDKNWVLQLGKEKGNKEEPCQALVREDGVLKLRIHFVQRPIDITEPRKIVFGLMASPAKPMPENWRNILFRGQWARAGELPGYRTLKWFGSTYWGARESMAETYPVGRDFSILSKMQEVRVTGKLAGVKAFMKAWSDRHLRGDWPDSGRHLKTKQQTRKLARMSVRSMRRQPDLLTVYWEEFHGVSNNHPETQIFGNEWSGGFTKGNVHALAESYRNFQVWYGAEFVRRGIGLYFDNTYPKQADDPATTTAYRRPSGRIQPSANMWRHRKYLRRIWVLHQTLAPPEKKPIMMFHMTNSHIVPYMGFGQTNLGLEWRYAEDKPFQARYSPALLRAQTLGLQTGNIPFALAQKVGAPGRLAGAMVHEIRVPRPNGEARNARMKKILAFGYGRNAEVVNYWDEDAKLTVSDERCKWLLLKKGQKRMLLLCTWNPNKRSVRIMAPGAVAKVKDAESGKTLETDGAAFEVEMPGYGVRLLRWRAED